MARLGAIPIGITAICVGLGIAMAGGNVRVRGVFIGLMLIAGGVATWFIGQHCGNQTKPVTEFDAVAREAGAPRSPPWCRPGITPTCRYPQRPGQLAEPWSVGQYVLDQEGSRVRNVLYNRHSLFFVPMQYFSFLMGAGGLVSIISALIPR